MPDEQQSETPLGDLLPSYVTRVLAKNGVHSVEGVKRAYPNELLKMHGIAMLRFRQIEAVFFPGQTFTPAQVLSPLRHISGASLNEPLSPVTVRALARGGITSVEQLQAMKPKDLLKIQGLGVIKLREIERVFF
ncbi:DNA repair protein RadC [Comamonas sp. BIGb0152]|uniref:helix-hairpin-helix domain-containing protein n=1 Tax=Comamonas sp. BIGb0152 TaxID=2940601 RepID=UPI0021693A99|nr:helix-hairpin-helix domain-containing protein [Comamonas sp. BIGb0152]MCS4292731.1 DNA repair protein RadC [Comamonas sp. BIGb0152]